MFSPCIQSQFVPALPLHVWDSLPCFLRSGLDLVDSQLCDPGQATYILWASVGLTYKRVCLDIGFLI